MMRHILGRVSIFVCLLMVFPVKADSNFSDMFVFGDSLSDTGNLASVIGDFPAPYVNNRASNGPVAVEVLAEKLGLPLEASLHLIGQNAGTNYAVASARAGGQEPIDLTTQVNAFLAVHGFAAPEDALYIMFFGGNDVRDVRNLQDSQQVEIALKIAVDNIKSKIAKLIVSGAKYIVVANAPDIGNIPETILLAQQTNDPELIKRTTKRSRLFNRLLKARLHDIEENYEIEIPVFDIFKLLGKIITHADSFGFDFTAVPCFYRFELIFHPDCNYGQTPNQFLFFDEEHPTAIGHAIVGSAMLRAVQELDVPDDDTKLELGQNH